MPEPKTTSFSPSSALTARTPGDLATPRGPSAGCAFSGQIAIATPRHLKFLSHLQKQFSNHLGYLPTAALQWYVEQKRIGLAFENNEPAGYVLGRTHFRYQPEMRPITQAAVAMDAQRRHIGLALVDRVITHARQAGQLAVQACCAADLDANEFWYAAGFHAIGVIQPDNARGRKIVVWRKPLTTTLPEWFREAPHQAGHRARRLKP